MMFEPWFVFSLPVLFALWHVAPWIGWEIGQWIERRKVLREGV
ncbi:hypothetical protein [Brevibacillus reuszeri]|nr:hypothetical protein [Brevibacillus reuszeri]